MPMTDTFTLYSSTVRIRAPRGWSDEQAEKALSMIEDAVEAALGGLGTRLAELDPALVLSHD